MRSRVQALINVSIRKKEGAGEIQWNETHDQYVFAERYADNIVNDDDPFDTDLILDALERAEEACEAPVKALTPGIQQAVAVLRGEAALLGEDWVEAVDRLETALKEIIR